MDLPDQTGKRGWMAAQMGKVTAALGAKAKLLRLGKRNGVLRCPCGAEGRTLRVGLAGTRNHLRAACAACNFSMME